MNNRRKPTVYRSKKKKKAGFPASRSVLPTIVTIAAAGAICYFGYFIAKPIVNSTESIVTNGDFSDSGSDGEAAEAQTTTTATESSTENTGTQTGTATTTTAGTNLVIINGGDAVLTTDGSGTGTGTGIAYVSGSSTMTTKTTTVTTTVTEAEAEKNVYASVSCAVRLPEDAVTDADALKEMLQNIKQQYPDAGAVVIPMKLSGGALNYVSSAAGDAAGTVCQGSMTASEIVSIVQEQGLYAYASCSLLDDHLYPSVYTYRTASYMIEKNGVLTGDQWLDNYADQGGKPWLDPGSSTTTAYLTALVKELSDSGFSAILCSGFSYPDFGPSDEQYLNPEIYAKNPDAMVSLANALQAAASDTTDIVLDLSGYGAMNGAEPVYQPDSLSVSYVLLSSSSADAASVSSWAKSNSGSLSVSIDYTDGSGSGHCVVDY